MRERKRPPALRKPRRAGSDEDERSGDRTQRTRLRAVDGDHPVDAAFEDAHQLRHGVRPHGAERPRTAQAPRGGRDAVQQITAWLAAQAQHQGDVFDGRRPFRFSHNLSPQRSQPGVLSPRRLRSVAR